MIARNSTIEGLEPRRLLAAGDLDTTFGGGDGVATLSTQPGSQVDRGLFTAVDNRGRIITVGTTAANRNFGTNVDILIARHTTNGLPDLSFGGGDGFVTRGFANVDVATDVAVDADGKILVAFRNAAPAAWAVLRLNDDGTPDGTFGNSGAAGVAAYDFGTEAVVRMLLQPDGRIVTVGSATHSTTTQKAAVVRMLADGTLDTDFSGDGIATVEFTPGGINEFFDVDYDAARGAIVAAGRARTSAQSLDRIAVARLSAADGAPDNTFDGDGKAEIAAPAGAAARHYQTQAMVVDGQSRVVVSGFVPPDNFGTPTPLNFWRLTAAGAPDASFNAAGAAPGRLEVTGAATSPFNLGDLLVQPDGKYLYGGSYNEGASSGFMLVRVKDDGTADETLSGDGIARHAPTAPQTSGGTDVALDPSLRAVMSGVNVVDAAANDFDLASIRVDLGLEPPTSPVSLVNGVLTVRGTDADDTVLLRRSGEQFLATLNGVTHTFADAQVRSIDVELSGGNDHQTHDGGVPGGRVDLGGGNNNSVTLNAGNRPDARLNVYGGAGSDTVTINAAASTPVFFDGGQDNATTDYLLYHGGLGNNTLNVSATRVDTGGSSDAQFARVDSIRIEGNAGFDTFNISATAEGIYELNGGDGDDAFNLVNGAPNTQLASTRINGGAGEDAFTYDDSAGGSNGATMNENVGTFNGNQVHFDVESMRYVMGSAGNSVSVRPSSTTRMTIEAGGPTTYPGDQLTIDPAVTPQQHTRVNYRDGVFSFATRQPVQYTGFERAISALDTAAPTGTGSFTQFARQEIEFNVSEDVYLSVDPADLELTNLTTGQATPGNLLVMNVSFTTGEPRPTRVTWRPFANQPLPNGNYRARIPAAAVRDYADKPMAADLVLEFFVLHGDINRDRRVDSSDFAVLAGNFGKTGMTYDKGDLTGDGKVDSSDFAILAANFGRVVPAPAPALAPLEVITAAPQPLPAAIAKPRERRTTVAARRAAASPRRPGQSTGHSSAPASPIGAIAASTAIVRRASR